MILGVNHITLAVTDVTASFDFYTRVLGFRAVARWPKGAYLLAGDMWIALVLDAGTRSGPMPEYTHTAFTVDPEKFAEAARKIREAGARIWQENRSEGESLYFLDPDGHKLEIHASDLQTRLRTARVNPWEGLEFFL